MNETEFIASLNAQQATFYNSRLIAVRTELQAMYSGAESALVATHLDEKKKLEDDAKAAQDEAEAKAKQLEETQAKVADLEQYRPFDPNVIRSEAFYERITADESFALGVLALSDETAKGILGLLAEYRSEKWKVLLDDPQVVGAMQYLTALAVLSEGRAEEITRPATQAEAYFPAD